MKLYLARLQRTSEDLRKSYGQRNADFPIDVFKVGITGLPHPAERLWYNRPDELFPICRYFSTIEVINYVALKAEVARAAEQAIFRRIGGGGNPWTNFGFHNWYEPDQISGITEMRRMHLQEFDRVNTIIESLKGGCHESE